MKNPIQKARINETRQKPETTGRQTAQASVAKRTPAAGTAAALNFSRPDIQDHMTHIVRRGV